jgi:hypothetical protein
VLDEKSNGSSSCRDAHLARIRRAAPADAVTESVWLIQHLHMVSIPQRQFNGSGRRPFEETQVIGVVTT